ncbi:uncharacterized protein BXZ73DRAFT_43729, partial [Epithele typhae]|uniref:uncharacterized protein n=1 Tax=Epithele typhae TaxID=378194 RepID=UPI00200736B1
VAMAHPVWSIAEVVREVMYQSLGDRRTLVSCAQVSRAISEPAVEVLWETLRGIGRLLALLPSSVKRITGQDNDTQLPFKHYVCAICGDIKDEEWARLLFYANLVRRYTTFGERIDGITTAVLVAKCGGRALFPRLTMISWFHDMEYSSYFIVLLGSPLLAHLNLNFSTDYSPVATTFLVDDPADYTIAAGLRLVHMQCPHIRTIDIHASRLPSVNSLGRFASLHKLTLRSIKDFAVIGAACGSLPHLKSLEVASFVPPEAPPPHIPAISLPSATELSLTGTSDLVAAILEATHAPRLASVSIITLGFPSYHPPAPDAVVALMRITTAIGARFAQTLRHVTLEGYGDDDDNDDDDDEPRPPTTQAFRPLFAPLYAAGALERLAVVFDFESALTLAPGDLADAARAWPGLRSIKLPFDSRVPPTYPITDLEALARGCPRLVNVLLPLPNAAPLGDVEEVRAMSGLDGCVNEVSRVWLPGEDWMPETRARCAAYLRRIFPKLKEEGMYLGFD